jgi:hypothetical protein
LCPSGSRARRKAALEDQSTRLFRRKSNLKGSTSTVPSYIAHFPVHCTQAQWRTGHVQGAVCWRHIERITLFRGQACSGRRRTCACGTRCGYNVRGADAKRAAYRCPLGGYVCANGQRRGVMSACVVIRRCFNGRLVLVRRIGIDGGILEMRVGP